VHPAVFAAFDRICARRGAGGVVLEVGAVPSHDALLTLPALAGATRKLGINREGPSSFLDFEIRHGDANDMRCFADASFDTILCNATLEHDPRFWMTVAEIRRVARPGALIVIGVPAFAGRAAGAGEPTPTLRRALLRRLRRLGGSLSASTPTLAWHGFPSDYYRFSPEAVREVLCADLADVEIELVLRAPRAIGSGIRP
jgi:SAM-dependent methyltransferase